jgi:hypothetical protein
MIRREFLPMRRVAILGLLLTATACATPDLSAHDPTAIPEFQGTGFAKFMNDTHTFADNPNLPDGDALNVLRVQAVAVSIDPLDQEAGTIWPGPPEPIKSLRDLQMESNGNAAPEPRMPSAQQLGNAGTGYIQAPKAAPSSAPSSASGSTVLTNADGSQTIIHPDGRVEFKPAPKK